MCKKVFNIKSFGMLSIVLSICIIHTSKAHNCSETISLEALVNSTLHTIQIVPPDLTYFRNKIKMPNVITCFLNCSLTSTLQFVLQKLRGSEKYNNLTRLLTAVHSYKVFETGITKDANFMPKNNEDILVLINSFATTNVSAISAQKVYEYLAVNFSLSSILKRNDFSVKEHNNPRSLLLEIICNLIRMDFYNSYEKYAVMFLLQHNYTCLLFKDRAFWPIVFPRNSSQIQNPTTNNCVVKPIGPAVTLNGLLSQNYERNQSLEPVANGISLYKTTGDGFKALERNHTKENADGFPKNPTNFNFSNANSSKILEEKQTLPPLQQNESPTDLSNSRKSLMDLWKHATSPKQDIRKHFPFTVIEPYRTTEISKHDNMQLLQVTKSTRIEANDRLKIVNPLTTEYFTIPSVTVMTKAKFKNDYIKRTTLQQIALENIAITKDPVVVVRMDSTTKYPDSTLKEMIQNSTQNVAKRDSSTVFTSQVLETHSKFPLYEKNDSKTRVYYRPILAIGTENDFLNENVKIGNDVLNTEKHKVVSVVNIYENLTGVLFPTKTVAVTIPTLQAVTKIVKENFNSSAINPISTFLIDAKALDSTTAFPKILVQDVSTRFENNDVQNVSKTNLPALSAIMDFGKNTPGDLNVPSSSPDKASFVTTSSISTRAMSHENAPERVLETIRFLPGKTNSEIITNQNLSTTGDESFTTISNGDLKTTSISRPEAMSSETSSNGNLVKTSLVPGKIIKTASQSVSGTAFTSASTASKRLETTDLFENVANTSNENSHEITARSENIYRAPSQNQTPPPNGIKNSTYISAVLIPPESSTSSPYSFSIESPFHTPSSLPIKFTTMIISSTMITSKVENITVLDKLFDSSQTSSAHLDMTSHQTVFVTTNSLPNKREVVLTGQRQLTTKSLPSKDPSIPSSVHKQNLEGTAPADKGKKEVIQIPTASSPFKSVGQFQVPLNVLLDTVEMEKCKEGERHTKIKMHIETLLTAIDENVPKASLTLLKSLLLSVKDFPFQDYNARGQLLRDLIPYLAKQQKDPTAKVLLEDVLGHIILDGAGALPPKIRLNCSNNTQSSNPPVLDRAEKPINV